jgi:hypothetical protein
LYSALQAVEPNCEETTVWAEPQWGQGTVSVRRLADEAHDIAAGRRLVRRRDAVGAQLFLAGLAHPVGGPGGRQAGDDAGGDAGAGQRRRTSSSIWPIAGQPL